MNQSPSSQITFQQLEEALSSSADLSMKSMKFPQCEYRLFYLETMIDTAILQDHVIKPLTQRPDIDVAEVVTVRDLSISKDVDEAVNAIVQGKTILQKQGENQFFVLGTELHKERSINLPSNERVLRGPALAFIENMETNLNMVRKNLSSPDLVVKKYKLGKVSKTEIAVVYLKGVANAEVVNLVEQKFQNIDIDYVEAPGFIQELVQDKRFSLFPQVLTTERPDRTRSYLMEGKAVIFTEGSPNVTILPVSFWAFFQSPDDYQISWFLGSVFRFLRIICFFIALGLPGLYISLVSFQTFVLPLQIALTLQSSLKYIALKPWLEIIIMMLLLEVLREASVRLANPIGQVIGVVGGIVVGTAIVQSNLISNTAVIAASFTALASFIIPSYEMSSSVRVVNYPVILLATCFGLLGVVVSYLLITIYLCRMNTMGLPYFYPTYLDSRDTLIRAPLLHLNRRPKEAASPNRQRLRTPRRRS